MECFYTGREEGGSWTEMVKDFQLVDNGLIAAIKLIDSYGFIDDKGDTIIQDQFDDVNVFSEGLCGVRIKNQGYGYINSKGEIVIKPVYENVLQFLHGLAPVQVIEDGKKMWGYIDKNGKMIIKPKYDTESSFYENDIAMVGLEDIDKPDKYGYINRKGEYIWEPTN
jgi:hypothetical protein